MTSARRSIASFALIALALLTCEGLLQVADRVSRPVHALLMPAWERDASILPDGRRNPYRRDHDASGYRNAARPTHADVVVLGDSHAYGVGVSREEGWPALVGAYNMALPEYGPGNSLLQLEDALGLKPRVLIEAVYFGNDFGDMFLLSRRRPELLAGLSSGLLGAAEEAERRSSLQSEVARFFFERDRSPEPEASPRAWVADHVKLYGLLRATRAALSPPSTIAILSREFRSSTAALTPTQRALTMPIDLDGWRTILTPARRNHLLDDRDPRIRLGFEAALEAIRRMDAKTRAAGARLLVVFLPTKESVFWPRGRDDERVRRLVADEDRLREELRSALTARGVDVLDLLSTMRGSAAQPYFEDVDGHPNAIGHRLIAEALVGRIGEGARRPL